MEKVITEFKVVETDDGFRIEIKGDKEALKAAFKHGGHRGFRRMWRMPFGMGMGMGGCGHRWMHHGQSEAEGEEGHEDAE